MGRTKKYLTSEEKYEAQKRWAMECYKKHKEQYKKNALLRYHKKKNEQKTDKQ
jgi:hypothetical protein